jgi:hypothetical protein
MSNTDNHVNGCNGLEASFGCYTATDLPTIGETIVTPMGLILGCGGSKDDQCRTCNLWLLLGSGAIIGDSGLFNYGNENVTSTSSNKTLALVTSVCLLLLLAMVIIKEVVGLFIVMSMLWQFRKHEGNARDYDAITVGKDSVAALLFLLFVLFSIYREEGWGGILLYVSILLLFLFSSSFSFPFSFSFSFSFVTRIESNHHHSFLPQSINQSSIHTIYSHYRYQDRFKLLEGGWSVEELEDKWAYVFCYTIVLPFFPCFVSVSVSLIHLLPPDCIL